ncbi:MAG: hypothetical protein N3I35_11475 [Clostridia bacterium]|nr:hypothetical protein [Clostridia bacterium]
MKTGIFFTVRTGSTRLPGKALLEVKGRPIISYLVERVKHAAEGYGKLIICTTTLPEDLRLEKLARQYGADLFQGDPENIVKRHWECAEKYKFDFIVNVDGDDILCDPSYIVKNIEMAQQLPEYDVYKSVHLPFGVNSMGYRKKVLDRIMEGFKRKKLDTGWGQLINNKEAFRVYEFPPIAEDMMDVRLSLDYDEDLTVFKKIIEDVFKDGKHISHKEILDYLKANPDVAAINSHVDKRYWENYNTKKAEEGR